MGKMNIKIFPALILIFALASCSINAGSPNTSSQTSGPTAQVLAFTALPTSIPVTIPTVCLPSAQAGDWPERADSNDWSAKVASACLTNQPREAIIQVLFSVWLNHFISPSTPGEYRLEKYALYSIDQVEDSPDGGYTAVVTYSVKPGIPVSSNPASWWVAGDGFPGEAGWVSFKREDVWIITTGGYYEIRLAPHDQA